jgi:hypothetical protein
MNRHSFSHDHLLQLANALASTDDSHEWSAKLRDCLLELHPSIDRISFNLNRSGGFALIGLVEEAVSGIHVIDSTTQRTELVIGSGQGRGPDYFVGVSRRAGLPVDEYRRPICLTYSTDLGFYVGSIILWSRWTSPPIDETTVTLLESLRPFLTFAFTSAFARFSSANAAFARTMRSIDRIATCCRLSRREREVMICRFNGKPVAEMARLLHISQSTVRRHIRTLSARLAAIPELHGRVLGMPFAVKGVRPIEGNEKTSSHCGRQ